MKAIQTRYRGCHFRSRLEARWAVFLDEIGIDWRYEHEGFEVASGVWYLPDFYLPSLHCYLEIKGQYPKPDELEKARLLGQEVPTVIFYDLPGSHTGVAWLFEASGETLHEVDFAYGVFEGWTLTTWDTIHIGNIKSTADDLFVPVADWGQTAIAAAKSARFERVPA